MCASLLPTYGLTAVLMLVLTLAACGGGGDGAPSLPEAWVQISNPESLTVRTDSIILSGTAACDTCPEIVGTNHCDEGMPVPPPAINVTWRNRTNGFSGSADHSIVPVLTWIFGNCLLVGYSHVWVANVPLMLGKNRIEITASGAGWEPTTQSITITRLPGVPGNLQAVPGKQQVTLSWDPVPDAASYNIYWSTSRHFTPATGTLIAGVTSPYTQTGLVDSETYYYIVTAVVFGVEGGASRVVMATPGWLLESVPQPPGYSSIMASSIATDSAGKAHLHFSSVESFVVWPTTENIIRSYYASNVTGAWAPLQVFESSRSSASGYTNPDIALDSRNTVNLSLQERNVLHHVIYASGAWVTKFVDSSDCSGSLGMDSAGKAHIGYFGKGGLRYATNTSGSWTSSLVVENPYNCSSNGWVSLGVNGAGTAHIAYRGIDNSLSYATNQGGSWAVSVIDQECCVASVSLAVDPRGGVHIVYTAYRSGQDTRQLKYAQNVSGTWAIETIESGDTYFTRLGLPSLSLDPAGKAHVSYDACHVDVISYICDYGELRYASNSSGTWHIAIIESGVYLDTTDIAVDSQGKAHISYVKRNATTLRYATNK